MTRDETVQAAAGARPKVVCICGSMKFTDAMQVAAVDESLAGHIVLLPLVNMKRPDSRWSTDEKCEQVKTDLDRLHLAKIDLADEVLVINPGQYIGDSTRREIAHAEATGKPIRFLDAIVRDTNGSGQDGRKGR